MTTLRPALAAGLLLLALLPVRGGDQVLVGAAIVAVAGLLVARGVARTAARRRGRKPA